MSTRSKGGRFRVFLLCALALAVGSLCATDTAPHKSDTAASHKKAAKKPQLPALPSGPTGRPVPQLPLDSIKPVAPQVMFQNGQLTIDAPNCSLGDILRAVKKQTNADIDIPDATDRVVTHLGPGPARAIIAELLNGSRFNYVLVGSPEDANLLTRVVLVPKSGLDNPAPAGAQQANAQPGRPGTPPEAGAQDSSDTDMSDDSASADETPIEQPAAEADQSNQSDQPGVKTPQQMLQEMQQRQVQFQQQLQQQQQQQQGGGQPGQNPVPPPGLPPGRVPPQQPPDQ